MTAKREWETYGTLKENKAFRLRGSTRLREYLCKRLCVGKMGNGKISIGTFNPRGIQRRTNHDIE